MQNARPPSPISTQRQDTGSDSLARAEVSIALGSPKEAEIFSRAMSVDNKPGSKSSSVVKANGETLHMSFRAVDSSSLRAVMNSVLREVKIANQMLI